MERLGERMADAIRDSHDRLADTLGDKIARVEAKGDARQREQTQRDAEASAWRETQESEGRRLREMIVFNDKANKLRFEQLEQRAVPEVAAVADNTASRVMEGQKQQAHRLAGLVVLGIPVGAILYAIITALFSNPEATMKWLHLLSSGVSKATAK